MVYINNLIGEENTLHNKFKDRGPKCVQCILVLTVHPI